MCGKSGGRVLIIEDQPLIVMDIEDTLVDAGFAIAGSLSSCASAMRWLATDKPDVVVLDIELRDGECTEVAHTLVDRDIPFVIHSGSLPNSNKYDPVFLKGLWVSKPSFESELVTAVRKASTHSKTAARTKSGGRV